MQNHVFFKVWFAKLLAFQSNFPLVSLISWASKTGLEPCPCFPNFLAKTTFILVSLWQTKIPGQDAIFGDFVLNSCNRKEEERRSIYSISILLLEFIFPFVRPSEYIIIPEVCAQGWYSGSTPVLFVEFGSFFLTFFFIFSSHLCIFFWQNYDFFCCIYGLFCWIYGLFCRFLSRQTFTRFL